MSEPTIEQLVASLGMRQSGLLQNYTRLLMEWHGMPSHSDAERWMRTEKQADIEDFKAQFAQDFLLGFSWACEKFPAKMRKLVTDLLPELHLDDK